MSVKLNFYNKFNFDRIRCVLGQLIKYIEKIGSLKSNEQEIKLI